MADADVNGPTASITFTKSPTPIANQTFPDNGNFTNMILNWTPNGSNVKTIDEDNSLSLYPNPFSAIISVNLNLTDLQRVSASVYDVDGRLVKVLSDEMLSEGNHSISWDASNSSGAQVSEGIYFVKITTGGKTTIKKVIFSK